MSEREPEKQINKYRLAVIDKRCGDETRYNAVASDPDGACAIGTDLFRKQHEVSDEVMDHHIVVKILRTLPANSQQKIDDDDSEAMA